MATGGPQSLELSKVKHRSGLIPGSSSLFALSPTVQDRLEACPNLPRLGDEIISLPRSHALGASRILTATGLKLRKRMASWRVPATPAP